MRNLGLERGNEVSSMLGGQEEEEVKTGVGRREGREMGEQSEKLLEEQS